MKQSLTKVGGRLVFLAECKRNTDQTCDSFDPRLSECHFVAALVLESGCKSSRFSNRFQIYSILFLIFLGIFFAKSLIYNHVVEHVFDRQYEREEYGHTLYTHMRARKGSREEKAGKRGGGKGRLGKEGGRERKEGLLEDK